MAQVTLTAQTSGKPASVFNSGTSSYETLITQPAGLNGHVQVMFVAYNAELSIDLTSLPGWDYQAIGNVTGTPNKIIVFTRALTTDVSESDALLTYSAGLSVIFWGGNFANALPPVAGNIVVAPNADWGQNPRLVAAVAGVAQESLHVVANISAAYPRSIIPDSLYTEFFDDYLYAGAGGMMLAYGQKNITTTGTVAESGWRIQNEGATADSVDQTVSASVILQPAVASTSGVFTATAVFPSVSVTIVEQAVAMQTTDSATFTATVVGSASGVTWALKAPVIGQITSAGVYTAEDSGTQIIQAISNQNNSVIGETTVTVRPVKPTINNPLSGTAPFEITGTALQGSLLAIYADNIIQSTVTTSALGTWALTLSQLGQGVYSVHLTSQKSGLAADNSDTVTVSITDGEVDPPDPVTPVDNPGGHCMCLCFRAPNIRMHVR